LVAGCIFLYHAGAGGAGGRGGSARVRRRQAIGGTCSPFLHSPLLRSGITVTTTAAENGSREIGGDGGTVCGCGQGSGKVNSGREAARTLGIQHLRRGVAAAIGRDGDAVEGELFPAACSLVRAGGPGRRACPLQVGGVWFGTRVCRVMLRVCVALVQSMGLALAPRRRVARRPWSRLAAGQRLAQRVDAARHGPGRPRGQRDRRGGPLPT
jgi:hypothetical protein